MGFPQGSGIPASSPVASERDSSIWLISPVMLIVLCKLGMWEASASMEESMLVSSDGCLVSVDGENVSGAVLARPKKWGDCHMQVVPFTGTAAFGHFLDKSTSSTALSFTALHV